MPISINIAGQVRQIKLAQNKALWPLFETVINAIQSLEDTNTCDKSITIEAQYEQDVLPLRDCNGNAIDRASRFKNFIITDNGNGFNRENYESFLEAYSQLKVKKGCKGIGRFLWLKAFDNVKVESTYQENGKWYFRTFSFGLDKGVSPENNVTEIHEGNTHNQTNVSLFGFKENYRDQVSGSLDNLAKKLVEHCLPYFIMGSVPRIVLQDNRGNDLDINDYYKNTYEDSLHKDEFTLHGQQYSIYHVLVAQGTDKNVLHLCANNREVKSIDLKDKIPNMQKRLDLESGSYFYVGYLTGNYLDSAVNMERSEFIFDDLPVMGKSSSVGESEIVDKCVENIKAYLYDDLSKIAEEKKKQIDDYVHAKKPQYRYLLNLHPEIYDQIPAGLEESKLDLELYRQQQSWEYAVAKKGKEIEEWVRKSATDDPEFQSLFDKYCDLISDLSRAGLAEYVAKRKTVVNLLENAIQINAVGKYSKEERIHRIICPMQTTSDEIEFDNMNLWLIDDRLAYHRYLASDKRIDSMPPVEVVGNRRTDITIFDAAHSYAADSDQLNSITIVEFKRPMRNDMSDNNDPVGQVLKYVKLIKEGKVKKANGRDFGDMSNVSFYCYIIGDLTEMMRESAEGRNLRKTQDRQGYFGYNEPYGVYIEVISYDKLLKDVKQRNQVFFEKLFKPKLGDVSHPEIT